MDKKSCCCSSVRSCFSCFSAPNNPTSPSSPHPDTTLDASSPRVDTTLDASSPRVDPRVDASSSSRYKGGSSSSGIPAAVKHDDSRPHESAGGSSPSKVPSVHPFEPAKVPTMVAKDDILQDHDSRHNVVSIATSSSQADASANDKVGEGSSSSSKNDDATLRTAPDLTSKIEKDVDAFDGEIEDLDGLIKHISELLDIIQANNSSPQLQRRANNFPTTSKIFSKFKKFPVDAANNSSPQLQRRAEEYFPSTSKIFSKFKKFLFDAKDVIPGEAIKTAVDVVLKGMGAPDMVIIPFVVVANILERFDDIGENKKECLSLLKEIIHLAKLIREFRERPQLNGTEGITCVIREATELIVEGSILCCTQMKSSKFSKFWAAKGNKEDLSKFGQKLRDMYMHMNAQMAFRLYDVIAPKKPRLSRGYPEHAVGIEKPVEDVLELLEWRSENKAVAVMLTGFGGMGKTTLADAVFSRANFEGCEYSKIRLFQDIESKPNIMVMQKCILKHLMGPEETIPYIITYEDGQRELSYLLEKVPAFIYIDNVLGENELRQLLPTDLTEAKKLRLLLTARDRDVGKACPRKTSLKSHTMEKISNGDAMSFLKRKGDMEGKLNSSQIDNIIDRCDGVPLMLTLVAEVLRFEENKEKAYNRVMRDKGKEDYFFAYDSLPDECKDPFLDVCLFFKGWEWDTVADIVGEDELDTLEKRQLVTKGIDRTAYVHDVILTFGHQRAEGTRFKFTSTSQFDEFLEEKDNQAMTCIKGISLNEKKDPSVISASKLDSMCKSLRVIDLGTSTKVEGQCNKIFENLVFFQGGITQLPFDVSKIKKLKYLKYEPDDLTLLKMPSSLKHMEFDGRLHSPSFQISSKCLHQLGNLRILRLINFPQLKKLPEEISDQVKLQELSLSYCKSLEELPRSISRLQSLRLLRMDYCSSLNQLAENFGSLKSLQRLNLQGCLSLRQLGEDFGSLNSLQVIDLQGCTGLKALPKDFGSLNSLQFLDLQGCTGLKALPKDFGSLNSLQSLDLQGCTGLKALPNNFENLSSLRVLNLSSCENLEDLPYGLGKLPSLVVLGLQNCRKLVSIPDTIGQLKLAPYLMYMPNCLSLIELPDGFCNLSYITELDFSNCKSLHRLPNRFGELASLRVLSLSGCSSLQRLPEGFGQLRYLEKLILGGCKSLEELCNEFSFLTSLDMLFLDMCESLKKLPEDFHCLTSLQHLGLSSCFVLEGKSMDSVVKIKTLKTVHIQGSIMLLNRWTEIQRESGQSWSFKEKVFTGQSISTEQKENIEKDMLAQLELVLSEGREKTIHLSGPIIFIVFDFFNTDFNYNFPWPLIEEIIDDIQINFEMVYLGFNFDVLPSKAKKIIVGHSHNIFKAELENLFINMYVTLGNQEVEEHKLKDKLLLIQINMLEDGGGGRFRPCWKLLTKLEMEESLLCHCRKYLQLKQLVETSQESPTRLLRELFAIGEAQTCTFQKAPSGNSKPLICTEEELKGKTILLEMRSLDVCYDVRLESLTQLYNTVRDTFNLEIISIPLVHRSSRPSEEFSRDIPWLVTQKNPWAIPSAVKYFLLNLCAPHEKEAGALSLIKIIESNGRIFTASKPVMGLLDRWGAKAYPFTVQKIEELKEEEWNEMETMSTLEFLFHRLEIVSDQVKEMMLHRKVVCLYGWNKSESKMKEFTCLIRNAFIRLRDNIHFIYVPNLIFKAAEERPVTDNVVFYHQPLEKSTLPHADMEGMLLLNLSQHDAFRFWRRVIFLSEELPEMYNRDTDKLGALKKLLQCWGNEDPWMILMDEEGQTITESGRKLVLSCKGSTEDEARGLIELLMKGSKEQRKEAVFKLEQMPDVENYDR